MDEGTLHMAKAMVNMSIHEEDGPYASAAAMMAENKTDKTAVGKIKMQEKLQGFRYVFSYIRIIASKMCPETVYGHCVYPICLHIASIRNLNFERHLIPYLADKVLQPRLASRTRNI